MSFRLTVVTPAKPVIDAEVDSVEAPGQEGEFGVLTSHEPFLAPLQAGVLRYTENGRTHQLRVAQGFAEVTQERVTVLTQSAEPDEA